jgi:outer membrane biosynthesis protein TonB
VAVAASRAPLVACLGASLVVAMVAGAGCEGALRGQDPNAGAPRPVREEPAPPIVAPAPPPPPEEPELPDTASSNAETVIGTLHAALRDCYEAALRRDPHTEGFTTLEIRLDPSGRVTSSMPIASSGLDARTTDCMASVVRHAVFDPPGPRGLKLNVPLRFKPMDPPPAPAASRARADAGSRRFP